MDYDSVFMNETYRPVVANRNSRSGLFEQKNGAVAG
jgi:hypothetical protein